MLKLLSINIEDEKHLDRVMAFIDQEKPDVLCLQEVLERDVPLFEKAIQGTGIFIPNGLCLIQGKYEKWGIGIFSGLPLSDTEVAYYRRYGEELRSIDNESTDPIDRSLAYAKVEKEGVSYDILTTHFTWTPDGHPTDRQRESLAAFLAAIAPYRSLVFCGDMNAPRGMETFEKIAQLYRDNIPQEYTTSLDPEFHSTKGRFQLMVDALFSTLDYRIENVRLQFGISDHAAIVAEVHKNN